MNLIDYIFKTSGESDNLIVSQIAAGFDMYGDVSEWSKTNSDYILIVPALLIRDLVLSNGCQFEYIITSNALSRKLKGNKLMESRFDELYHSGRIVMLENTTFAHLKHLNFKINLTSRTSNSFEKTQLNQNTSTYWVETTGKTIFNFRNFQKDWVTIKQRESQLKKLLQDE